MELEFVDSDLENMVFNAKYTGRWSPAIVKMVRRCVNYLIQSPDRRAIYDFPGYQLEKLKGKLKDYHSLRLNDQYRLRVQFLSGEEGEILRIICIEDYHK